MKVMTCPLNGPRNISEFLYLGELLEMPDAKACEDREWAEHVWFSENKAGVVREWWCHLPSSYWFIAERDTVSDRILKTYTVAEYFEKSGAAQSGAAGEAR